MGQRCFIGLLVGLACQLGVAAESSGIYVERTESGAIRFTDQPSADDARPHRLTPLLAISLPEEQAAKPDALQVPEVEILSPRDDEAIRSNHGEIRIRAQVSWADELPHTYGFVLDGELVGTSRDGALALHGVDRGTHRLHVRLTNSEGGALAKSDEVRFHMLRYAIPSR